MLTALYLMKGKLLAVSVGLFIVAIIVSLVGERTLPLFGSDRELAARVYQVVYILLGGAIFAFALPAVAQWFLQALRHLFADRGDNVMVAWLISDSAQRTLLIGSGLMMALVLGGSILVAILAWYRLA